MISEGATPLNSKACCCCMAGSGWFLLLPEGLWMVSPTDTARRHLSVAVAWTRDSYISIYIYIAGHGVPRAAGSEVVGHAPRKLRWGDFPPQRRNSPCAIRPSRNSPPPACRGIPLESRARASTATPTTTTMASFAAASCGKRPLPGPSRAPHGPHSNGCCGVAGYNKKVKAFGRPHEQLYDAICLRKESLRKS